MKARQIKKLLVYSTNSTIEQIPDMTALKFYKKRNPHQFDYHFVLFPDGILQTDVSLTDICRHGNPEADKVAITLGVVGGMIAAPTQDDPSRLIPANTLTDEQRDILILFFEQQKHAAEKEGQPLDILGCNEINQSLPMPGFDVQELLTHCEF